ncbi:MAG: cation transporter [Nitrospirales bacterium]|nr:MAG: cation transporter [Nitrospirales bacterium]
MIQPQNWSFSLSLLLFLISTSIIGVVGWQLTRLVDRLAARTGLGEAVSGAIFLGVSTSLPGIVTSVTTAFGGHAEFAVSHALGGIAIQTAFLAVADMTYRRANLEHAAASPVNLMNGVLLITMLSLILLTIVGPEFSVWGTHPATALIVAVYLFGLRLVQHSHTDPLWKPKLTFETKVDIPEADSLQESLLRLSFLFTSCALIVGCAGWILARAAISLVNHTGLSETIAGGLFTTVSTSLPELVTAIAAVRSGALTLAVGGIIGGNTFDVLLVAISDVAYQEGSIYHAITDKQIYLMALAILMNSILLLGLLRREEHGIANIGFESMLILLAYVGGMTLLFLT